MAVLQDKDISHHRQPRSEQGFTYITDYGDKKRQRSNNTQACSNQHGKISKKKDTTPIANHTRCKLPDLRFTIEIEKIAKPTQEITTPQLAEGNLLRGIQSSKKASLT